LKHKTNFGILMLIYLNSFKVGILT